MQTTSNPLADLIQAVAFAADKHRNQRRKDTATKAAESRALFGEQMISVVSVRKQPIDFPKIYSRTGISLDA